MRPPKYHTQTRHAIARAYFAGAAPSEIAEQYGESQAFIIATAKWLELRLLKRQAKTAAIRERRFQAAAQVIPIRPLEAMRTPKVKIEPLKSAIGRELGIVAVRQQGQPSMPYVSIQHPTASQ